MQNKNLFFVVSSAVLCAASFLYLSFLWWLSFIFLVPLFLLSLKKYSFLYGFVWGIVFFTLHSNTLWHVCRHHAVVAWWFVIPMILIFWFCIWSGIWFYFLYKTSSHFFKLFVTTIYFLSMHDVLLTPLSWRLEGYPFASPLIPLFYGGCLGLLAYIPLSIVYALFILAAYLFAQQQWFFAFVCLFCLALPLKHEIIHDFSSFMCITPLQKFSDKPYERAQELGIAFDVARYMYPDKKIFLFPESVFPYAVNDHSYMVRFFEDQSSEVNLMFGGYRYENEKLFNTVFLLHKGRITYYYDKRFLVTFFECHHPGIDNQNQKQTSFIFRPFLAQKVACSANTQKEYFSFSLSEGSEGLNGIKQVYVPIICSEALWYMPYNKKAIAFVNDSYFYAYFAHILYATACFNAYKNKTKLFYCGYQVNSNNS